MKETKVDYERKLNEYKEAIESAKKLGAPISDIKTATTAVADKKDVADNEKNHYFSVEQKKNIVSLLKLVYDKVNNVHSTKIELNNFKKNKKLPEEIEEKKLKYKSAIEEKDNEIIKLEILIKKYIITAKENLINLISSFKEKEKEFKKSKELLEKAKSDPEKDIKKTNWKIDQAQAEMDTKEILMREAYDKVIEVRGDLPQINVPKSTINLSSKQKQKLLVFNQDLAKATKTLQDKRESLKIIKENLKQYLKTKEHDLNYKINIENATIAIDEAVINKNKAVRELIKAIRRKEIKAKSNLRKAIDTVAEKQAFIQKKQKEIDEQKTDYSNILNQLKIPENKNIATLKEKLSKIKIFINRLSVELSIAQVELEEAKQEVDKFTKKK